MQLGNLLEDESGATLVEYALIVGLIAIACIAIVTVLSHHLQTSFSKIGADL